MMVTLVGLLKEHHRLTLTDYEIAAPGAPLERIDLGISGGLQDQYAATFGGFNYIEFDAGRVVVNPLRIGRRGGAASSSTTCCSATPARPARSDRIIEDQTARYLAGDGDTLDGLRMQKQLAVEMKDALLRGRLYEFGDLLGQAWQQKKPDVAADHDAVHRRGLRGRAQGRGALGGKVTGAGGGGYMLFYCAFSASTAWRRR